MMKASSMPLKRWRRSARMRSADRPLATRSGKGARDENTVPALGALVKVAPSSPANGTAWATPGVFSMMSATRRTTASVRASEAPGGRLMTVMR